MHAPQPMALRCRPRAFCTVGAVVLIGMLVVPGMQVWALDDEAARATLKGLSGVVVWVGDIVPEIEQSGVTKQQLQTEVERQVHRAGIAGLSSQEAGASSDMAFLTVSVSTIRHTGGLYAYAVDLAVYQAAALLRDPTPRSLATWAVGSMALVEATNLRAISTSVSQQVERFIQAYRAVNPRASPLDGRLGLQTCVALRHYQQRKGLRVTGNLDPQTLKALRLR